MCKTVIKFGGSNLKNPEGISLLEKVINSYDKPVVVVVSALFGVTDFLLEKLPLTIGAPETVKEIIVYLEKRNNEIIDFFFTTGPLKEKVENDCKERLNELERYLTGINCIGEVPDFMYDLILSFGERFSSLLISSVLIANGHNCVEVLPEELQLTTTGEYGNSSVEFDKCEDNVLKALSGNKNYIVPGFYGISPAGKTTLFGRGGSDYSAACIARCINAPSLDIWKDVNGFLSGDPKFVNNPVRLKSLTYSEAAELSYFGAKILHPRTVEPLSNTHIPIRIFNSTNPGEKPEPLTVVNNEEIVTTNVIKSISFSNDFCIVKLKGPGVGIKPGILAKVTTQLNNAGINISSVITSQIAINLLISVSDLEKTSCLISDLSLPVVQEIAIIEDITLIAVVGQGMLEQHGIASRLFSALARKEINILLSSLGASQVVTYLIVEKNNCKIAVNEIHKEFFETNIEAVIKKECVVI